MAHAERCPVCGGRGKINTSPLYSPFASEEICHGCGGKGWVVVPDEKVHYKPPETTGGI